MYDLIDQPLCPDGERRLLDPILLGDACSDLDDSIKELEEWASCPAGANCGINTGVPAGEPSKDGAVSNVASLAFIVSLVCLLLKF